MLRMNPLTVAEHQQRQVRPFIDRVVAGEWLEAPGDSALDLRNYLSLALRGGFPEPALELGPHTARAWLESYADQVALRDARVFGETLDARRLQRHFAGGRIIGIEIKSAASVGRADARHLEWLNDAMEDRFVGGVVLHTGRDTFELADRIVAAPISVLWA